MYKCIHTHRCKKAQNKYFIVTKIHQSYISQLFTLSILSYHLISRAAARYPEICNRNYISVRKIRLVYNFLAEETFKHFSLLQVFSFSNQVR